MQQERRQSPHLIKQRSQFDISANSNSSRRKSSGFKKQHTLVVEKTTPFDDMITVDEERIYKSSSSRSLTELICTPLPAPMAKLKTKLADVTDQSRFRKRRSHKDIAINNIQSFNANREATENIEEFDQAKSNEDFNLILDVLTSHFIFFFSNLLSCRH